jgi:ParB family chromosome partitioning protein
MPARKRPNMSALLDDSPARPSVTSPARGRDAFGATSDGEANEIPTALIDPSPANPRAGLGEIGELASSIASLGIISPLLVSPKDGRYEVVHGHRRLAAARSLGLSAVPAVVSTDTDPARVRAMRLAENIQREDLTPTEEAGAYAELMSLGITGGQRALAKMVGKSDAHISKRLALLRLPAEVLCQIDSGRIALRDAAELTKLADQPERLEAALRDGARWNDLASATAAQLRASAQAAEREAHAARLAQAGVAFIDMPKTFSRQQGPVPLYHIGLDEAAHAGESCHAAFIPDHGSRAVLVCLDPQAHRSHPSAAEEHERAAQEARHAEAAAARAAAAQARHDFCVALLKSTSPDAGAKPFVTWVLAEGNTWVRFDAAAIADLLGLSIDTFHGLGPGEAVGAYASKGVRNAQRVVHAMALTIGEAGVEHRVRLAEYFAHLVDHGYCLGEYEQSLLAGAADPEDDYDDELDGAEA